VIFCVPGRYSPGRGTQTLKYGTSREIRDSWQPYYQYRHFCVIVRSLFAFSVVLLIINLHIKFEVCSFTCSTYLERSPTFNKSVTYLCYAPFSPNFTICVHVNVFDIPVKFCDDSFYCRPSREMR